MALPALTGLARRGSLVIHAPVRLHDLYAGLGVPVRPLGRITADLAVLFAPSLRAAWEARRVRTVVGTPTDFRWLALDRIVPLQVSRSATYRSLAEAAGAEVRGAPAYTPRGVCSRVPPGHLALFPLAAGGANRRWRGFRELADSARQPVVFYPGPGETARVTALAGPHVVADELSLPDLAATLQLADRVVANDSGPAHFARSVGRPTVVVHTSTTAARTGAAGSMSVEGPELPCRPCYRNACAHDLECLAIPVDAVRVLL